MIGDPAADKGHEHEWSGKQGTHGHIGRAAVFGREFQGEVHGGQYIAPAHQALQQGRGQEQVITIGKDHKDKGGEQDGIRDIYDLLIPPTIGQQAADRHGNSKPGKGGNTEITGDFKTSGTTELAGGANPLIYDIVLTMGTGNLGAPVISNHTFLKTVKTKAT